MPRPRSSPWRGAGEGSVLMRALCVCGVLLLSLAIPSAAGAQEPWSDPSLSPDRRADLVVDAMTLPEKAELMSNDTGTSWAYFNAGVERLGIPSLRMLDAGSGLRLGGVTLPETENRATAMPSTMLLAAAFDPGLAARYGRTVADEVREVGGNVLLGPNGDIVRTPWWGRANEAESEDPLLTGRVVGPYVRAVKDRGVIADLKHYNLYTQELNRNVPYDVRANDRTIQEIYTPPWKAAVDNGLGSTMCSFNQLNGDYACENRQLLTDILKRQLGFKGFVLTDFGAAHSTVQSLNNGLDMETGNRQFYTPETILAAVESGRVTEATVDEHVHRILRTMFEHGLFEDDPEPSEIPVEEHGETAREVAEGGITLLKNSDAVLPLNGRRLDSVAVIGGDANRAHAQGGASHVSPTYEVSLVDGIRDRAPGGVDVEYAPGTDPVGPTSMLAGPGRRAVVDLHRPGRRERAPGHVLQLDRPVRRPDHDAHGARRALRDQLPRRRPLLRQPVRLAAAADPVQRGLGALLRDVHRPAVRRLHLRPDRVRRGGDDHRRRAGDRLRQHGGRRGHGAHRDAQPGGRRGARGHDRVPGHAALHRPRGRLAAARVDASRQRLLTRHRGGCRARARLRGGGRLRVDVRERAARPRLADAAERPGPADPRRVRGQREHRRRARRGRAGADAVAQPGRRDRRQLLRRPGAGQRDRQRALRRRQPLGQAAGHVPAQRAPARAAGDREPLGHARRSHRALRRGDLRRLSRL